MPHTHTNAGPHKHTLVRPECFESVCVLFFPTILDSIKQINEKLTRIDIHTIAHRYQLFSICWFHRYWPRSLQWLRWPIEVGLCLRHPNILLCPIVLKSSYSALPLERWGEVRETLVLMPKSIILAIGSSGSGSVGPRRHQTRQGKMANINLPDINRVVSWVCVLARTRKLVCRMSCLIHLKLCFNIYTKNIFINIVKVRYF